MRVPQSVSRIVPAAHNEPPSCAVTGSLSRAANYLQIGIVGNSAEIPIRPVPHGNKFNCGRDSSLIFPMLPMTDGKDNENTCVITARDDSQTSLVTSGGGNDSERSIRTPMVPRLIFESIPRLPRLDVGQCAGTTRGKRADVIGQ